MSRVTRQPAPRSIAVASRERDPWEVGLAVRRDWPDGTHDLVGYRTGGHLTDHRSAAERFIRRDRNYWRRGPLRPLMWTVVLVSHRDFELHLRRHKCRAPDCPTTA